MAGATLSARIRTRTIADGTKRYIVLYRRGGRYYPVESLGTFKRLRDAQQRRDLVAGWLAQVQRSAIPELLSFAAGINRDEAAVRAGLAVPPGRVLIL